MLKYSLFFVFLIVNYSYCLLAQDQVHKIEVLLNEGDSSVQLRWAPTTPSAWLKLNKYGYTVERITLSKRGIRLKQPEINILSTVLPEPLEKWEKIVGENDYAAIIAQALYGESFSVEGSDNGQDALLQIINRSREIEQRFAFGLFAADMNYKVAVKAGVGHTDNNVVVGEEYLYRVNSKVPIEILDIKNGSAIIKISEIKQELPRPIDVFTKGGDQSILITWDHQLFRDLYVAYFIERSENDKDYIRLNEQPLVNMSDKPGQQAQRMTYIDSIPTNQKKYYYRIIGLTSFGEESPVSDSSVSEGYKKLAAVPRISKYKLTDDGGAQINWEFKKEAEKDISSFEINRANSEKGPFKTLIKNIDPSNRTVKIKELEPSNYFTISAIGSNNQKTTSLNKFIQAVDSIPPVKPVGLEAKIDTTGVVRLKWNPNLEKDLLGYRIYRANIENEEYVQLTISPIAQENFDDNIKLKSLNDKVYYKVIAVDKRFNMSEYSAPLVVKKPDVVPPSAPVFENYKVEEGKVNLTWISSTSKDVAFHKLYKKSLNEENAQWQLIFSTLNEVSFTDTNIEGKERYRYAIFAEDESGLVSEASTPITITAKSSSETIKLIKRASGLADRIANKIDLSWNISDQVKELLIYKAKNDEKPVLFKQYSIMKEEIEDSRVNPGNVYNYTLRVTDHKGNTEFKKITVTY